MIGNFASSNLKMLPILRFGLVLKVDQDRGHFGILVDEFPRLYSGRQAENCHGGRAMIGWDGLRVKSFDGVSQPNRLGLVGLAAGVDQR